MSQGLTDAELFDLIVRIIEDETRTKSYSIDIIRKLVSLTDNKKEESE